MNEHTRYRTGTADLKKDLQKKINELKSSAWDCEQSEKYVSLIAVYRDLVGMQGALIALLTAENEDMANGHESLFTKRGNY